MFNSRHMKCNFACKAHVRKNTTEVNHSNGHSEISFVTQTVDEEPPIGRGNCSRSNAAPEYGSKVQNCSGMYSMFLISRNYIRSLIEWNCFDDF